MKNTPHQANCIVLIPNEECPVPAESYGLWLTKDGSFRLRTPSGADRILSPAMEEAYPPADSPVPVMLPDAPAIGDTSAQDLKRASRAPRPRI